MSLTKRMTISDIIVVLAAPELGTSWQGLIWFEFYVTTTTNMVRNWAKTCPLTKTPFHDLD